MMTIFDTILKENLILYVIIFSLITLLYILILKKQLFSMFDPLLFASLQASGAFTTNIILKKNNLIEDNMFYSFLISEFAFLIGLLIVKNREKNLDISIKNMSEYANKRNSLFILSSIIYVILQLYVYYKNGIPLFRDTLSISLLTMDARAGTPKKILDSLLPILIICSIDFFVRETKKRLKSKVIYLSVFLFVIVTLLLSGWKSNILIIIFMFAIYMLFIYGEKRRLNINFIKIKRINRRLFILLIFAIISALMIISYNYLSDSFNSPIFYLIRRFFLSGDIFIYSYTDPVVFGSVEKGNFIANILSPTFLGKIINIYSPNSIVRAVGVQVFQLATGTSFLTGPNPRHNFNGLLYFGIWGSIIYSFFIGLLTSFTRNFIYNKAKRNLFTSIISCTIIYYITYAHIDLVSLCISRIYYFFVVAVPIFIVTEIIYKNIHKLNYF